MVRLLVVAHDFHMMCTVVMPYKTKTPLVVDSNAVLTFAIRFEKLQLVAGWHLQAVQLRRGVQLQELAPSDPLHVSESRDGLAVEQVFRLFAVD
jgi:hypothetical protein